MNKKYYRLMEIVFLLFFRNQNAKNLNNGQFWNVINCICDLYSIDKVLITKAIRILTTDKADEIELYYILKDNGFTVREINRMTGIYWQKQKAFEEELKTGTKIQFIPRIQEPLMRKAVINFVSAVKDFCNIFLKFDQKQLDA